MGREWALAFACLLLLFAGCAGQGRPAEGPTSDDSEVSLIVGENYSLGEPIAFQLKTSNYSISYINRSQGFLVGSYPSVWICRQEENGSCSNVEFRRLMDFSRCSMGRVVIEVPPASQEKFEVIPAESYELLLRWDQTEWVEEKTPCGGGVAVGKKQQRVAPGNYSATFVYWVSWEKEQRSVSADFRIR